MWDWNVPSALHTAACPASVLEPTSTTLLMLVAFKNYKELLGAQNTKY